MASRIPKECGCGCGGMTGGGTYLPGHDARLKSRLKKAARNEGDQAAFERLMDLGWAVESDRVKLLGVQEVGGVTEQAMEIDASLQDKVENGHATPAEKLRLRVMEEVACYNVSERTFATLWRKAMQRGWPDHSEVRTLMVRGCSSHIDRHENSVRDTSHDGASSVDVTYHRSPCRKCGHGSLVVRGDYDSLLLRLECEKCGAVHTCPRSGISGGDMAKAHIHWVQVERELRESDDGEEE